MKNKKILLGAAASAVIASALLLSPTTGDNAYQLRANSNSNTTQGIAGAFEFYNQIRKNVNTGVFNKEDYLRARDEASTMASNRATLNWLDNGPDNVGGRTRAILIDKSDDNHLFAGSVSGGLFESTNRGNAWSKVNGFADNLAISSMCMTDNGNIFVATGHSAERVSGTESSGANGEGVYVSTDGGVTFTLISGTEGNSYINEVVAKGNDVFIASSSGLEKYTGGTLSSTSVTSGTRALSISNDGSLIIVQSGGSIRVSTDGGSTFTNVLIGISGSRYEFAISHEKVNGKYYIYGIVASSAGRLAGVVKSTDHGDNWTQIAPANTGDPDDFAPFGSNRQGNYDNIITVVKGNPEAILIGGVDIFSKSLAGNWEQNSNGFVPQLSPIYVHSDQHEMQWDSQGRLWVGNDGGVFYSDDNGNSYREADRGYNVTQFYKIGFSAHGDVIGGAQDNGTQANYHDNGTYREHDRVGGGDGFGCAMSFMNRDILFSTIYHGAIYRSGSRGTQGTTTAYTAANIPASFGTPGGLDGNGLGSFYTAIELYENPNDLNSKDTVVIIPTQDYDMGEEIEVNSLTSQQTIPYTLTEDIEFQDTLNFNGSLTTLDTVLRVVKAIASNPALNSDTIDDFNLNNSLYNIYAGGGPTIDINDQIVIEGVLYDILELTNPNHYYGTLSTEPGEVVDMGLSSQIYDVAWDTIKVVDPYQSWFAFGLGSSQGIWLTRNGLRLAANHDGFLQAADANMSGSVTAMDFSKDGNHLFVGTSGGQVWRISGLANVYSPDPEDDNSILDATTFELVKSFGKYVSGLSTDGQDADGLVVTLGTYGSTFNNIQRTTTATQGTNVNFTNITGNLPFSTGTPFYSCVVDRDNSDIILAGCDFGIFLTEDGGTTWENASGDFGNTPVFDLGQNWRTWDEGCYVPGEIYAGTHGRGIWSSDAYLGVQESQDNLTNETFKANLTVYPNPVANEGTISFNLDANSDVNVQIYNLSGQIVQEMREQDLIEGANTISINTMELAKGTYIVKLSSDNFTKTTKFIKH